MKAFENATRWALWITAVVFVGWITRLALMPLLFVDRAGAPIGMKATRPCECGGLMGLQSENGEHFYRCWQCLRTAPLTSR